MNGEVHTFIVDDQKHPQINEIYAKLKKIVRVVHNVWYVPYIKFVLHDVEEEERCFICVTIMRN